MAAKKPGLYANIQKKKQRIAKGSGEKMRKPGSEGAPTTKAFKESAKTAKKPKAAGAAKKKSPARKSSPAKEKSSAKAKASPKAGAARKTAKK